MLAIRTRCWDACYSLFLSQCLLESFIEKTIKKQAQLDNYLFYSQTVLIDPIRDSQPFPQSTNTHHVHVTPHPHPSISPNY